MERVCWRSSLLVALCREMRPARVDNRIIVFQRVIPWAEINYVKDQFRRLSINDEAVMIYDIVMD